MSACSLNILNIMGGGARGYLASQWFLLFLARWGVNPLTLWQQFGMMSGTSVGSLLVSGYALGLNPVTLDAFFTDIAPYIFTQRTNLLTCSFGGLSGNSPSNRPNSAQKLVEILAEDPFYSTSGGCTTYGSTLLYSTLVSTFGAHTMQDYKTNVIIPAYQVTNPEIGYGQGTFRFFSNLTMPYLSGQNELIVNTTKASSAAPVYLPAAVFNGNTYLDGGLYANNPVNMALATMRALKPLANRACVLSIGTGLGTMQFAQDGSLSPAEVTPFRAISNIFSLFDIASTGGQETASACVSLESSNTLTNLYSYTFQPILDPALDTTLDNTTPEILEYYRTVATTAFNNDLAAIDNFIGHLMA